MALAAALVLLAACPQEPERPELRIGGRLHQDFFFVDADPRAEAALGEEFEDGAEVRRARLRAFGRLAPQFEWFTEFDFAGGADSELRELSVTWTEAGPGRLKAGFFKEPVGLERSMSTKFITFTEENAAGLALAPGRNAGLMWSRSEEAVHGAAGLFRVQDPSGRSEDSGWGGAARVVWRPWFDEDAASLLHLGVSAAHHRADESVSFGARPEAHGLPRFVDTGPLAADAWTVGALEAAWMRGPWHAQGEWLATRVAGPGDDPALRGWSLSAGRFLTADARGYDPDASVFHRVRPHAPLGEDGGWGAWEVAARYTVLDLAEAPAVAHALRTVTLALNGYLNESLRLQLDWTQAAAADLGDTGILTLRFAIEW